MVQDSLFGEELFRAVHIIEGRDIKTGERIGKFPGTLPAPKPIDVAGLRKALGPIEKRITFCRQNRLENTRKRLSEAEHFRREAEKLEKLAATITNLANALEAGTAPSVLHKIRSRAHVERINYWAHFPVFKDGNDWIKDEIATLHKLGIVTEQELTAARAALAQYAEVQIDEAEKIRRRLVEVRADISRYKIPGFFRTQPFVSDEMMKHLIPRVGQRWLEPSAGDGSLRSA